jgi:peptide/nickel transport system ATP-binding protein
MESSPSTHPKARAPGAHESPVLEVADLSLSYRSAGRIVPVLDGVTFSLSKGQSLGLVGESGSGKTSIAMAIMGLLPPGSSVSPSSSIRLSGRELLTLSEKELRDVRWSQVSMVFQGAMNAWNPVLTIGEQIREVITRHSSTAVTRSEVGERIDTLLAKVSLRADVVRRYPHELSGGMRQRAMIAMALACSPELVIADEPTTALDVIVQGAILKEIRSLQTELDLSMIYVSHDLSVIRQVADIVGVMYAGRMVEVGPRDEIFENPQHPYTALLLAATPRVRGPRLAFTRLKGEPPSFVAPPQGCRFHPRCPVVVESCRVTRPEPQLVSGRQVECWRPGTVVPAESQVS